MITASEFLKFLEIFQVPYGPNGGGGDTLAPCTASTTANLSYTYNNGSSGIGATLTAGSVGAFTTDGVSPAVNSRILVAFQTAPAQNGIYTLTTVGDGATAAVLTRSTDYDTPAQIKPGETVLVIDGSTYGGAEFVELNSVTTIGTDPIAFSVVTNNSYLLRANNLSDLVSTAFARTNLGVDYTYGTFSYSANYSLAVIQQSMIAVPSAAGLQFKLPVMTSSSWPLNRPFLLVNNSAFSTILASQDGTALTTVLANEALAVVCTNNSTANGTFVIVSRYLETSAVEPLIVSTLDYGFNLQNYSSNFTATSLTEWTFLQPSAVGLTYTLPDMTTVSNLLNSTVSFKNNSNFVTKIYANGGTLLDTLYPADISHLQLLDLSTAAGSFAVTKGYLPLSEQGIDIFDKFIIPLTSGATRNQLTGSVNGNNAPCLTFPQGATTFANASMTIPLKVGNTTYGATLICNVNSALTTAATFYLQAVYRNQGDAFDIAYGTPIAITVTPTGTAYQTIVTPISAAIVPAGSGTAARFIEFRLYRQSDALAADVNVLGCLVYFNFVAANDLGAV